MPNPRLLGLFVFVCAAALYFGSTKWIETREYNPLNIPISLAEGQTRHVFRVNGSGNYQLSIQAWPDEPTPVRTTWSIRRNGHVVANGSKEIVLGREAFIGSARLRPGLYTLEFNVLSDNRQLNKTQPRLDLDADGYTYNAASDMYGRLILAAMVIGFVGASVVVFLPHTRSYESWSPAGVAPLPAIRMYPPLRVARRIKLPVFGYFAAVVLALTMLAMMTLVSLNRLTSKGLWVGLLKPGVHAQTGDQWSQPIVVRVTATESKKANAALNPSSYYDMYGDVEHFFIDGEEVPAEQFKARLSGLLATRADRTVYIQGDDEAPFDAVANAIGMAHDSYASRIVLLTESDDPTHQQPEVFDDPPKLSIPEALRHSLSK